jgi:hypothetical protein
VTVSFDSGWEGARERCRYERTSSTARSGALGEHARGIADGPHDQRCATEQTHSAGVDLVHCHVFLLDIERFAMVAEEGRSVALVNHFALVQDHRFVRTVRRVQQQQRDLAIAAVTPRYSLRFALALHSEIVAPRLDQRVEHAQRQLKSGCATGTRERERQQNARERQCGSVRARTYSEAAHSRGQCR